MKDNSVGLQGYPLDMSLGHNPAKVRGLPGLVPVPLLEHLLALVDESALHGAGAEDVVRSDARLAQVEHLAPKDAANGYVQVCRAVHVARAGGEQGGMMFVNVPGGFTRVLVRRPEKHYWGCLFV